MISPEKSKEVKNKTEFVNTSLFFPENQLKHQQTGLAIR
jgi:hypothetical protein